MENKTDNKNKRMYLKKIIMLCKKNKTLGFSECVNGYYVSFNFTKISQLELKYIKNNIKITKIKETNNE